MYIYVAALPVKRLMLGLKKQCFTDIEHQYIERQRWTTLKNTLVVCWFIVAKSFELFHLTFRMLFSSKRWKRALSASSVCVCWLLYGVCLIGCSSCHWISLGRVRFKRNETKRTRTVRQCVVSTLPVRDVNSFWEQNLSLHSQARAVAKTADFTRRKF